MRGDGRVRHQGQDGELDQEWEAHVATTEDFKAVIEEQEPIFVEMDEEHGKEFRASAVALETKFQEDL